MRGHAMEESKEVTEGTQEGTQSEEVVINDPKAVLEALARAKNDAKANRERLEAEEKKVAELQERVNSLSSDEVLGGYKRRIIELQVKSSLEKEGIKETDRVAKYLSFDSYDLDDEGNVTGFSENLEQVKKDLPELFDAKRRAGGAADIFKNEEVKQKMTGTEAQVARLFNH
jgi:hypothetical protein